MQIINLLKEAKSLYLQEIEGKDSVKFPGMCWCIKVIANKGKSRIEQSNKGHVPYTSIIAQIPEFNPTYLNAAPRRNWVKCTIVGLEFWWDIDDTESRINAFNKLIEIYEGSDKEFVW